MSTLDAYQFNAVRTAGQLDRETSLVTLTLGLAGESGEVADLVKKHLGHGHPLDEDKVVEELGDVLWYVATLAYLMGRTLSEVAAFNRGKLEARYPLGFSTERSINRGNE